MKRLFCIVLVLLHLVNLVGGYWLFYAVERQTELRLAQDFDIDNYAGSQAILIKLPLSQPVSGNENYERVDGAFEYEGTVYRLVKQKFYKDTAYIVCYKHEKSIVLKKALKDYVETFTDNAPEKKSESKSVVVFIKDYLHHGRMPFVAQRIGLNVAGNTGYVNHYRHLTEFTVHHPPEVVG